MPARLIPRAPASSRWLAPLKWKSRRTLRSLNVKPSSNLSRPRCKGIGAQRLLFSKPSFLLFSGILGLPNPIFVIRQTPIAL